MELPRKGSSTTSQTLCSWTPGPCKAGASDRQHIAWGLRDSSSFLLGKSGLSEDLDSSVLIALAQSETAANFPAFGGRSSQPACMPSPMSFPPKKARLLRAWMREFGLPVSCLRLQLRRNFSPGITPKENHLI